jgi:tyrosine-protein kinase
MTNVSVGPASRPDQTIADYLAILRRHKWVIVTATLAVPLVAYFLSAQQPKVFEARAEVLLNKQDLGSVVTGLPTATTVTDPERYAQTQAALARVPAVAAKAVELAGVDLDGSALLGASGVTSRANADLLTFAVRDGDPETAVKLAGAYARAFTAFKLRTETESIERARRELLGRLTELRRTGQEGTATYSEISRKAQDLRTLELLQVPATVVDTPSGGSQIAPAPRRNALLGLFLGIALGLGAALLLNALDRTVREVETVEQELRVPLLARLPAPRGRKDPPTILDRSNDEVTEAVSRLRANTDFVNSQLRAKLLMVTSALEGEGKSTTAANLAIMFARTGRRVVLVDFDLRRPSLARLFHLSERPGVTDVVTGSASLEGAVAAVGHRHVQAWSRSLRETSPSQGLLEVLTAGRTRIDPDQVIEMPSLATMFEELRKRSDLVLIDASPILTTADAMALTAKIDAILLVNRVGTLTRSALHDLARALDRSPAPTLGLVATGTAYEETYYYGYRPDGRAEASAARLPSQPPVAVADDTDGPASEPREVPGRWARPSSAR